MGVTDWEPRALPSEARCDRWAEQGGVWFDGEVVWAWEKVAAGGRVLRLRTKRLGEVVLGAFRDERFRFCPMKKGNTIPWSDFFTATHPPIPEGWEKVGEWAWESGGASVKAFVIKTYDNDAGILHSGDGFSVGVRRILPAIPEGWEAVGEWHDTHAPCSKVYDWTLLQDGRIVQRGETFRGKDERIMGVHIRRVFGAVDWGDVPRGVTLRPTFGRGGPRNDVILGGAYVGRVFDKTEKGYFTHGTDQMPVAGSPFVSLPAAIVALTGRRE
jgi:hypothetical protein